MEVASEEVQQKGDQYGGNNGPFDGVCGLEGESIEGS